uniref:RagB/SusD family nutrient uptake outer membrane protein n=1 Tax=Bacteroides salyersiae TaxID=291644 RepID=UPI0034A32F19
RHCPCALKRLGNWNFSKQILIPNWRMFEGQRFWDVRRWKIADKEYNKTLMAWNPRGKTVDTYYQLTTMYTQQFVAPRDYFWPIKEKSLVINPNLVQNPGWQ